MATQAKMPFGRYCAGCGGGHYTRAFGDACEAYNAIRRDSWVASVRNRVEEWGIEVDRAKAAYDAAYIGERSASRAKMAKLGITPRPRYG